MTCNGFGSCYVTGADICSCQGFAALTERLGTGEAAAAGHSAGAEAVGRPRPRRRPAQAAQAAHARAAEAVAGPALQCDDSPGTTLAGPWAEHYRLLDVIPQWLPEGVTNTFQHTFLRFAQCHDGGSHARQVGMGA